MQFCKAVDHFKTLPDNKLEKEARAIAAEFVGEGTPKAVSLSLSLASLGGGHTTITSIITRMKDIARQGPRRFVASDFHCCMCSQSIITEC